MPTYDYACQDCGQSIEVMHGVNDTGPGVCANCGGPMRKLLSTPAILFKGSGWAKKDARSAAKPSASKSDSGDTETSATKAKGDAATESKTEAGSTEKAADSGSGSKSASGAGADSGT